MGQMPHQSTVLKNALFKNSTLQSWHKIRLQHDWITVLTEEIMKVAIAVAFAYCLKVGCTEIGLLHAQITEKIKHECCNCNSRLRKSIGCTEIVISEREF